VELDWKLWSVCPLFWFSFFKAQTLVLQNVIWELLSYSPFVTQLTFSKRFYCRTAPSSEQACYCRRWCHWVHDRTWCSLLKLLLCIPVWLVLDRCILYWSRKREIGFKRLVLEQMFLDLSYDPRRRDVLVWRFNKLFSHCTLFAYLSRKCFPPNGLLIGWKCLWNRIQPVRVQIKHYRLADLNLLMAIQLVHTGMKDE